MDWMHKEKNMHKLETEWLAKMYSYPGSSSIFYLPSSKLLWAGSNKPQIQGSQKCSLSRTTGRISMTEHWGKADRGHRKTTESTRKQRNGINSGIKGKRKKRREHTLWGTRTRHSYASRGLDSVLLGHCCSGTSVVLSQGGVKVTAICSNWTEGLLCNPKCLLLSPFISSTGISKAEPPSYLTPRCCANK